MILGALRLFRSLSTYHYRTIFLTILLPAIGAQIIAYFGPDYLVLRVILYVATFLVWSVFAVLAVASMLNRDRSEAEQLIAHSLKSLSGQIESLREEHQESRLDLRQQVESLEEAVASTLKEELGVVLRPRRILIRAKVLGASGTVSAALGVVRRSRLVRLRQWFRRARRRLWELVYGKADGH